jgi:hypothetical protein
LLGLLLLAGLLVGAYFLVRAIDSGAGTPPTNKPNDINYVTNVTTVTPSVTAPNATTIPSVINTNGNQTAVIPAPVPQNTTDLFSLPPVYTVPSTPVINGTSPTTPVNPAPAISVGSGVSQQLYFSDPNIQTIDQYLRQQDAYRLGNDPVLTDLALKNTNGTLVYELT